ncbi:MULTISPECIES: rhomboid family protein [Hymenobacter]|uniref:Rhomboid family intramembrane serine protease n=1 Tax=Hymenobacter jejuensis TaxID=2502781 RepID=A0A5B7ZVQ6_9BACT|nr:MULTISPECIES: rhomboid family intramembrane serine protease [Hymenobacter]MBC6988332.1 rhomboid family intramembrane serine protease [Hymenobacter sp. BT491]QDA59314.1 rhomboid family intramembrane serine protease [Hymenobacter jejuensis]
MSIVNDIRTAFSRRDNALNQLLLINVLVFAVLILIRAIFYFTGIGLYDDILRFIALPSNPVALMYRPWTVLTYAFVHEGFLHILFNLLNLYWFGSLVREYLGDRKLVNLYILGALAGAFLFVLSYSFVPVLQHAPATIVLGASGAVMAVIVGAATLLPDYTFNLIFIGPVKIKYIALAVVLISLAGVDGGNTGGEIAHIGGAMLGFLYVRQLQRGRDLGRPVQAVGDWVGALLSGRPRLRVTHRSRPAEDTTAPRKGKLVKPEQEEIDLILDKISRSGYESLSKEEKQKLFRASQK